MKTFIKKYIGIIITIIITILWVLAYVFYTSHPKLAHIFIEIITWYFIILIILIILCVEILAIINADVIKKWLVDKIIMIVEWLKNKVIKLNKK
jgi:hypothetical protein